MLQVTGQEYVTKEVKSLEKCRADMTDSSLTKEAFACHVTVCVLCVRMSHTAVLDTPASISKRALLQLGHRHVSDGFPTPTPD